MFARLRRRFVLITVAAVAAVLLCVGVAINSVNYWVTTGDLDELLTSISTDEDAWDLPDGGMGGRTLREGHDRGGRFQSVETAYSTRWFSLSVAGGVVVDTDLAHIASVDTNNLSAYAELTETAPAGFGFSGEFRYLVVKNSAGVGEVSTGYFVDASEELYQMGTLLWTTIGVGLVALAVVSIVIIGVSGRVIQPLVEADRRQKRFVTDASHELKTPLAVIRTSLAMLKLEPEDATADRQKWIEKTEVSTDRIATLVDDMVTLARVDEEVGARETSFDVAGAVRTTADEFEDHALASGHDLTVTAPPKLLYKGDEPGVRRLVSVLLDNAIRYAAPGGAIQLAVESAGRNSVRITCENPVESLEPADLDHLFDRFYRPDESRTQSTGGFGIGLSIAKSICESTGGTIEATLDAPIIRFTALLK